MNEIQSQLIELKLQNTGIMEYWNDGRMERPEDRDRNLRATEV
jgi:hypothetical protein